MIAAEEAEKALTFLRETAPKVAAFTEQARLKAHQLKYVEALLVKGMANQGVPATVQREYARADDRYREAFQEEAAAAAELIGLNERRDTAKITISLYQSMVKDRM
jgi:hypothetical protein